MSPIEFDILQKKVEILERAVFKLFGQLAMAKNGSGFDLDTWQKTNYALLHAFRGELNEVRRVAEEG